MSILSIKGLYKFPVKSRLWSLLFMFFMVSIQASAQFNFDVETVEALIRDHKNVRSVLIARNSVEQANLILHQYSRKAVEDHYQLNVELDKFTRLFDMIDIIVSGTSTVFNAKNTYSDVSKRLEDYRKLLQTYTERLAMRGNIQLRDTIIIGTSQRALEHVYEDGKDIYASLTAIIAYSSGKVPCNTSKLLKIIENINKSLDDIRRTVNAAYIATWRYMQMRLTYYKAEVYRKRSVKEVSAEALDRWKVSGKDAITRKRN